MYVHFLNDSQQGLGGGWSFMANLRKALTRHTTVKIAERMEDADICLVSGATMVTRQTIDRVQELGKKLVTRLDNVPRNSRNRNTGTSRLKEFAERADLVVWQCQWAIDYLGDFIHPKKSAIIYNSVDETIFKKEGVMHEVIGFERDRRYLYSRFNRDETKNWEKAWYHHQIEHIKEDHIHLTLVGQFSPEQATYAFDFFRGEQYEYLAVIQDPIVMAQVMRACKYLYATYFCDCYSNTYLEFLMCGGELIHVDMSGGTPELIRNFEKGIEFNSLKRMAEDYANAFESIL